MHSVSFLNDLDSVRGTVSTFDCDEPGSTRTCEFGTGVGRIAAVWRVIRAAISDRSETRNKKRGEPHVTVSMSYHHSGGVVASMGLRDGCDVIVCLMGSCWTGELCKVNSTSGSGGGIECNSHW